MGVLRLILPRTASTYHGIGYKACSEVCYTHVIALAGFAPPALRSRFFVVAIYPYASPYQDNDTFMRWAIQNSDMSILQSESMTTTFRGFRQLKPFGLHAQWN
ncbi:hypothetical protein AcW1_010374 [Taiwanofungus camphoratus]|nr:hypothetical protein AcV5_010441 [Antrodia cinnamomea]KAI0942009.1 hypothetical protein AcV7_002556 [Antrodia cinnamomea]KAI0948048.1 hypothetical protein AcW1_010374 [Antrodia cinnamomea]